MSFFLEVELLYASVRHALRELPSKLKVLKIYLPFFPRVFPQSSQKALFEKHFFLDLFRSTALSRQELEHRSLAFSPWW